MSRSPSSAPAQVKALLFDIGGVVVLSPLAAITDYEQQLGLPSGYINSAIGAAAPMGAFQRLERGEMALDERFFADFGRDVRNKAVWERVMAKQQRKKTEKKDGAEEQDFEKATSRIDARALFWTMMRAARHPDPYVYPAVQKLVALGRMRAASPHPQDRGSAFVVGALSNAVVFPPGIRDERGQLFDAGVVLSGPSSTSSTATGGQDDANKNSAPVPPLFDIFLHSAHIGLRKPDPRVYALALERLSHVMRGRGLLAPDASLRPNEVLFLDDIGVNLKIAREFGFQTCKVEIGRTREAVKVLERAVAVKLLDEQGEGKAKL